MINPTMLTVPEVAKRLNVNKQTVYRLCEHNLLANYRIGLGRGTLRIEEDDLEAYLNRAKPVIGFTHGLTGPKPASNKRKPTTKPKRPPENK